MGFFVYFIAVCVLDYIYFKLKHTKTNGPPVYYFFPFVGVFPFYCLPKSLFEPLFRYYIRNFPDVILTRLFVPVLFVKKSAIQDVQFSDKCLSRPAQGVEEAIGTVTNGKPIFFLTDNNNQECPWQSIRKLNVSALNVLPKAQKFKKTAEVIDHFLKKIEEHEGQLYDYADDMGFAKFQESSNVNLGKTFEANNIGAFVRGLRILSSRLPYIGALCFIFPFRILKMFEHLFPLELQPTLVQRIYAKLTRLLVEERIGRTTEPRDFVEAVLHLRKPEDALEFVRHTVFFNMLATTHTTQHTTMATLSFVSLDKRVQQKILEELDRVVGSAPLSQEHMSDLHYLKAAIHEASRLSPPVPTVTRLTTAPAKIGGYTVESNLRIGALVISEGMDPEKFQYPEAFIPERHLKTNGEFEVSKHFNIFSRGKRMCPGVDIASLSALLHCAKILQHFEIFPERTDIEVPTYSGSLLTDSPAMPLRFVRREGSPAIDPPALETGLTAFVKRVVDEELAAI